MRVLITGATGFLGSNLVLGLLHQGHEVVAFKRSLSNTNRLNKVIKDICLCDIDCYGVQKPFRDYGKIDAVIHTATCYGRGGESTVDLLQANVLFPLKVLETAIAAGTELFLNTDSVLPREMNLYALTKSQFVELGYSLSKTRAIQIVNLRLEQMYGPLDDITKFPSFVIRNCVQNIPELKLTSGEQQRDFIFIDDVVEAYMLLLSRFEEGLKLASTYGLGSGKAITLRQFVETVHVMTQSTTRLEFGAIPYRDNELMFSEADITRLFQHGWKPKTDLATGINKCLAEEVKR